MKRIKSMYSNLYFILKITITVSSNNSEYIWKRTEAIINDIFIHQQKLSMLNIYIYIQHAHMKLHIIIYSFLVWTNKNIYMLSEISMNLGNMNLWPFFLYIL